MGIDVGTRRIGLAISDRTRTLARPLTTIAIASADEGVRRVADHARALAAEDDSLTTIVVGLPTRLDGTPNDQTARVHEFIASLKQLTEIPIVAADERLSSVEAESRLAGRFKDWRERRKKLDAAAAAVILQDFLDQQA